MPSSSPEPEAGLGPTDLELCGEFLVLVAALLELKARVLLSEDDELELDELDADEAAAELAERLAEYRRVKAGAAWLEERLAAESDRFFRAGPAPLGACAGKAARAQDPARLESALMPRSPPSRRRRRSRISRFAFRRSRSFSSRFRAVLARRRRFVFDEEVEGLSRVEQAVAFLALLELRKTGEIGSARTSPSRRSRLRPG